MSTTPPAAEPVSRLLQLLNGSLPMYLADSGVWSYPGPQDLKQAVADIVGDQKSIVDRAGAMLEERSIVPRGHEYPLAFASLHDLDMRHLLPRLIESFKRQLAGIDAIIDAGSNDAAAIELAREARTAAVGHLEQLTQFVGRRPPGMHAG